MVLLSFYGRTQNLDTTKNNIAGTFIPDTYLKTGLKLIERGKQCERELKFTKEQKNILLQKVQARDSTIEGYKKIVAAKDTVIFLHQKTESLLKESVELYQTEVMNKDRKISKLKRQSLFTKSGLIATVGIIVILLFK